MPTSQSELCVACQAAQLRGCRRKGLEATIQSLTFKVSRLNSAINDPQMTDLVQHNIRARDTAQLSLTQAESSHRTAIQWCTVKD